MAEDVIHNVFTHLFENAEILQKVRSPKAWLYTAITNKSLDTLKKNKSQLFVPLEDNLNVPDDSATSEDPLKSVLLAEKMEEVRAAVRDLPPDLQELVHYRYTMKLKVAEIARCVDLPVGTVKTRLAKARRLVRSALPWAYPRAEGEW